MLHPPRLTFRVPLFLGLFLLACLSGQANAQSQRITKVYVPKGQDHTVRFETDAGPAQVLIQNKKSVFSIMATSADNEWVMLSKMPANPDEASGTNEETILMYVPQKRIVRHPKHGRKATVISIDKEGNTESVTWDLDGATLTTPIDSLRAGLLGDKAKGGAPDAGK